MHKSFRFQCIFSASLPTFRKGVQGRGKFRQGRISRGNFAVKKSGEIFPWRNFGVTVPCFTTAAGIVFPEQGQARL